MCACRGFNVEREVVACGVGAGFQGREWRGCGGVHVGSVGVLRGEVWLVVCVCNLGKGGNVFVRQGRC